MNVEGRNILITGANRGIGAAFVEEAKRRGAAKIYAAARDVDSIAAAGVERLRIDVTDPQQIAAAVEAAGDVHILVNNAGISTSTPLVTGDEESIRREMDTNFFGPLRMTRAFAPVLARGGGGAIVNVISALSWFTTPMSGAYAASKAAAWALTDSTRLELTAQGTHVVAVHMGLVDTDMSSGFNGPKVAPLAVAHAALGAVESGTQEVLADDWSIFVKSGLTLAPAERYEQILGALRG
ncbi:SDR family oxidoreductase [Microbacterium sp. PA5]|uniref:SDR family oxidoreductase n=1 Tax=Microbacterium sp. PA5 TaxID=3416654 RepID=UPI003CEC1224